MSCRWPVTLSSPLPWLLLLLLATLSLSGLPLRASSAAEIRADIRDRSGRPVEDAVVTLAPVGKKPIPKARTRPETPYILNQRNRAFHPYVLVIPRGASVQLVNSDDFGHHVFSFSNTKRFDVTMPANSRSEPLRFDRSGSVAIGCNIHDFMIAFIHVTDAPYWAVSAATGRARLTDLPAGSYRLSVWHPRQRGRASPSVHEILLEDDSRVDVGFDLRLRADRRKKRRRHRHRDTGY